MSAEMLETARQAAVASVNASAASAAGVPGPEGNFISGAPHDAEPIAATRNTPRNHERTKQDLYKVVFVMSCFRGNSYFFGSFCFAARIFLSISDLLIESPSPFSARVKAATASS